MTTPTTERHIPTPKELAILTGMVDETPKETPMETPQQFESSNPELSGEQSVLPLEMHSDAHDQLNEKRLELGHQFMVGDKVIEVIQYERHLKDGSTKLVPLLYEVDENDKHTPISHDKALELGIDIGAESDVPAETKIEQATPQPHVIEADSPYKNPDDVKSMFEYAIAHGRITREKYRSASIDELAGVLLEVQPAWSEQQAAEKLTHEQLEPVRKYAFDKGLVTEEQWAKMSPEKRAATLSEAADMYQAEAAALSTTKEEATPFLAYALTNGLVTKEEWAKLTWEQRAAKLSEAADHMRENELKDKPQADPKALQTASGWRAYYKNVKLWGKEKLQNLRGEARTHKKAIAATLVGVVALGGAIAGIRYDAEHQTKDTSTVRLTDKPSETDNMAHIIDSLSVDTKTPGNTVVTPHETLDRGQNPWTEARGYLESLGLDNPTDAQIATVNNWVMKHNHINVAAGEDRRLPVGTQLQMPSAQQVEQLLNITL